VRCGATNTLTDVEGIRVGHHSRLGRGWLTGTTVVLAPPEGAVAGVDVRGGGPGTRETDLLDPRNAVERVHAIVLSGGSAFGRAAADGVALRLAEADIGVRVGPGEDIIVPLVPAAVVFDLGRGGDQTCRPDGSFGAAAYDRAAGPDGAGAVAAGSVGAGTGVVAGGLNGGVGSASAVLDDGTTVAAILVVNSLGSTIDPRTGELYGLRFGLPGEFAELGRPSEEELAAFLDAVTAEPPEPVLHTTLGVVATSATLTKAQCAKVAGIGHDGMARAIRPVHSMLDGDTVFAVSTERGPAPDQLAFHDLLTAAADCVTRAVVHAVLAATSVVTPAGTWLSHADAFPSAYGRRAEP
jgi:putative pantetheine hydrolase